MWINKSEYLWLKSNDDFLDELMIGRNPNYRVISEREYKEYLEYKKWLDSPCCELCEDCLNDDEYCECCDEWEDDPDECNNAFRELFDRVNAHEERLDEMDSARRGQVIVNNAFMEWADDQAERMERVLTDSNSSRPRKRAVQKESNTGTKGSTKKKVERDTK